MSHETRQLTEYLIILSGYLFIGVISFVIFLGISKEIKNIRILYYIPFVFSYLLALYILIFHKNTHGMIYGVITYISPIMVVFYGIGLVIDLFMKKRS